MLSILQRVTAGELQLANSGVLLFEVHRIVDHTRLNGILHFLSFSSSFQSLIPAIEQRGIELYELGFKRLDALHLASAEAMKANVLLTTDDRFLNRANLNSAYLTLPVLNPVQYSTT